MIILLKIYKFFVQIVIQYKRVMQEQILESIHNLRVYPNWHRGLVQAQVREH